MANNNFSQPPYGYSARQGQQGQGQNPSPPQQNYGSSNYPQYSPQQSYQGPSQTPQSSGPNVPGMLPIEQSYIENILRLNKGKLITLYTTFENNREWNAKVFKGVIEAAGRDHIILSDPQTGERDLIPMVYVDYITFSEPIEYEYPYGASGSSNISTYPPR